jgi:hypothetical protein
LKELGKVIVIVEDRMIVNTVQCILAYHSRVIGPGRHEAQSQYRSLGQLRILNIDY